MRTLLCLSIFSLFGLLVPAPAAAGVIVDENYAVNNPAAGWRLNTNDPAHPIVWEPGAGRVRLVADGDFGRAVSMIRDLRVGIQVLAFTAEFSFEITPPDPDWVHADGFVFFIGAADMSYLGWGGSHMGWGGPGNTFPSVAVEIDTWRDGEEEYENWSENHIGVAYLPDGNGDQPTRSAFLANPMDFGFPDFEGGGKFSVRLQWACGEFTLSLRHPSVTDERGDPIWVIVLRGSFPFYASFIGRPGFTAGTGAATNGVYLHSVRIETPEQMPCGNRGFSYPIRINAGGTSYVDSYGNRWDTDMLLGLSSPIGNRAGGGYAGWSRMPVDKTHGYSDRIYASERWGESAWTFHVPNGTYTVILHFSEFATPSARRAFWIDVEDRRVGPVFWPTRAAGGMFAACSRAVLTEVVDGDGLSIVLSADPNWPDPNPKISAIEVHDELPQRAILPGAELSDWPFDIRLVSNGASAIDANGYVRAWHLLGPFRQSGGGAPDVAYMRGFTPLPAGREAEIASGSAGIEDWMFEDLSDPGLGIMTYWDVYYATETAKAWILWMDDDDGISFDDVYRPGDGSDNVDNAMAYAVAYVGYDGRAGDTLPITIGACSDDSILVRVNGEEVLARSVVRGWGDPATVQDRGDAVLRTGMNVILAKVFEGWGGFGFRLRLEERGTQKPLTANDGITIHESLYAPVVAIGSDGDWVIPGETKTFRASVVGVPDPLVFWDFSAFDGLYVDAVGATASRAFNDREVRGNRALTFVVTAAVSASPEFGSPVTTVEKRVVVSICELGYEFGPGESYILHQDEPFHLGRGFEGAKLDVSDGVLHVSLPRGRDFDSWTGFDYAPKLLVPVPSFSDWAIETRVTELSRDPNDQLQAGLIVILDETGYVPRPGYLFYGITRDAIELSQSGSEIAPAVRPPSWAEQGRPPYTTSLRIEKRGTEYRFYYRLSDAQPWTLQLTRTYGASARYTGLFAKNWGLTGGEFAFDYLRFRCIEPPPPSPEIDVSPLELAFGNVLVGSTKALSVTVSNLGAAPLAIDARLAAGTSAEFRIARISGEVPIPPGGDARIAVEYTPAGVGPDIGSLLVHSDDPDEAIVTVRLSGSGGSAPAPEIDVSPPALAFGDVIVGSSRALSVTIRNLGTADLNVSSIALGAGTSADFTKTAGPASATITAGNQVTAEVTYRPGGVGSDTGSLVIRSNDADESTVTVGLSGNGIPVPVPEIDVSPPALAFGDVMVGSSRALSVRIRNLGTANLNVSSIALGAGTSADFTKTAGPASATITAGNQVTAEVTYRPGGVGPDTGSLVIRSNDADEGTVTVGLSGNGLALRAFRRGDCNDDGNVNVSDAVMIANLLFVAGTRPSACLLACDVNASERIGITDCIYLLNYLFRGGPDPAAPWPRCGPIPESPPYPCEEFNGCPP